MKNNKIDMRQGGISKQLITFAIPLIMTNMLQLLYNAADVIVVGRFAGTAALSAVGSTGPIINLCINAFMGLSVGSAVMFSKNFGANNEEGMQKTLHTALAFAIVSGVLCIGIGLFISKKMLIWMNSPADVIDLADQYMKIFFLGSIFNAIFNFGSACMRAVGDTKRPLKILSATGIINVVLNLILVIVFKMSVAGVAIATITAQAVSAFCIIKCLMKETGGLKLHIKKIRIYKEEFIMMVKIGLPAAIQSSMFSVSNSIVQGAINIFGSTTMAATAASGSIEGFMFVALNSMHQASMTFSSQNLGAGQYNRIRKCYVRALGIAFCLYVIICIPMCIFAENLISIYDSNPEVIVMGAFRLRVIACGYFFWGFLDITLGQMRGLGSSLLPTAISLVGICGFRVFWVATIFEKYKSVETLYYSYPVSWVFTFGLLLFFYLLILKKLPKEDMPLRQ